MVLPACKKADALVPMQCLRTRLAELSATAECPVTVSVGVSEAIPGESFEEVIGRADAALHVAKESGRDQVVGWCSRRTENQDRGRFHPAIVVGPDPRWA